MMVQTLENIPSASASQYDFSDCRVYAVQLFPYRNRYDPCCLSLRHGWIAV
jgi:hypothetical protein